MKHNALDFRVNLRTFSNTVGVLCVIPRAVPSGGIIGMASYESPLVVLICRLYFMKL